jgi:twinkle protein
VPLSNKRTACPLCRAEGKDSTGNHLRLFEDETGGWCYQGGHGKVMLFDTTGGGMEYSRNSSGRGPSNEALTLSVVNTYPVRPYPDRKISQATMDRYGVRCEVDTSTGEPAALYYPYHSEDGQATGYKKRRLDDKSFMVVGKPKGLFGQKACKTNAKFVIVVEGEQDVLAAWELLQSRGKDWNVVSIPNGANEEGVLDKQTLSALEWIASHPGVCLALDADKPGRATAKALAEALVSQTEVKIANLSPRKDTADYWEAGDVVGWFKAINSAQTYRPEAVVEGCDIDVDVLMTPKEPGIELPYPKLQRMTWGLRKGEITLLTAGSGIGKSTWVRELTYNLVKQGHKVAMIALETQMEDVARMFVAMDNNVPGHKLMFNPACIPRDAYIASTDRLFKSNSMHFFKHWGSIAAPTLRQKMHYFAKVLGVDFIVLDHVSMVVAGSDTSDERKDIDMLFEGMTQVTNETGVGILPIIHLKRVQGKKFNKGDEVELTDLRGSAGAEQMSFNVWALERNQQGETKDLVKIRVLKNRLLGFTGEADTLRYDHETGRLLLHTIEDFD